MTHRRSPHIDRKTARAATEIIQRSHCTYRSDRCDCKFGVAELGKVQGGHEHGCGCPELRTVAVVLAGLTDAQYTAAFARGQDVLEAEKSPKGFVDGPSGKLTIDVCNFSVRTSNALYSGGIKLLGHLAAMSSEDLCGIKRLGERGRDEVEIELAKRGLALKGEKLNEDVEDAYQLVLKFFGNEETAQLWFSTPNPLLGGATPDSLLALKPGKLLTMIRNQLWENGKWVVKQEKA